MKTLIVILCTVFVAALAAPAEPADLIKYKSYPYKEENKRYTFEYELSDGTAIKQTGKLRVNEENKVILAVTGEYSWVAPNGKKFTFIYKADQTGYSVERVVDEENKNAPGHSSAVVACLCG